MTNLWNEISDTADLNRDGAVTLQELQVKQQTESDDKQTEELLDRETDRQMFRQTDRQKDRLKTKDIFDTSKNQRIDTYIPVKKITLHNTR